MTNPTITQPPILEARSISHYYGGTAALTDVSITIQPGQIHCVLGDNGAGKSTLIKILSGLLQPTAGQLRLDGQPVVFTNPRAALDAGIATVYQDLATVPLMPVWRNFFLGRELTRGRGPARRLDRPAMRQIVRRQLADLGLNLRDVDQPIGTLSGGERQCVAIARAIDGGARALILDEPTAALGVKQSEVVLRYIRRARDRGLGLILITHNPQHAWPVGDRFLLLNHGQLVDDRTKNDVTVAELATLMAGGVIHLSDSPGESLTVEAGDL
ncbi:MAG: ATP-binding cassette domain-containing protein [Propionibacteriaceae bacterium]|jgi:simple sugar transport system ATP-binding protein|nr:ATP-binding cassette domain-containing protein [Propionibacteriaceae bacterium]